MNGSTNRRASAGGARAAGGVTFQAQVFAVWAARSAAEKPAGLGLNPDVRIETVGCETAFEIDDVGVFLNDGGWILIQAKGGMRRLATNVSDLCSAVDQVISTFRDGIPGVGARPVDTARDRLVIATNQESSKTFAELSEVLARLRDHPSALPIMNAAVNGHQRTALTTFVELLRSRWGIIMSSPASDEDLLPLLRAVEVACYDFAADGADQLRAKAMLVDASIDDPFGQLVSEGLETARTRSWRSAQSLQQQIGVQGTGIQSAVVDRERLVEATERTLARLAGHTEVAAPEGRIHVPRQIVADLQYETAGFLIVGIPGAGKSGVLVDLARLDHGDKVVLAVDSVPEERALAQFRWSLSDDLAEVLRAWDGSETATLYLDGLDAHRGGGSWLADLVEELRDTRWRVVASVRHFDLRNSLRWQEQFKGAPIPPHVATGTGLDGVRHVVVQPFDADELAVVTSGSPKLEALVNAGVMRLRELLMTPFNLSLAGDLVDQVPVEQLATVATQVQLLTTYWRTRVGDGAEGYLRHDAVRRLVEQMVSYRSLEVTLRALPPASLSAVEELVNRGVLDELVDARRVSFTKTVRFQHHLVFDFALAATLFGSGEWELASFLVDDPDFVIFGRPAIDVHLTDLWETDRNSFWRTTIDLASGDHPLAVAAATATAVQGINAVADVHTLVSRAETSPDACATVVLQLASALEAAPANVRSQATSSVEAYDTLVGKLGDAWIHKLEALRAYALVRLIWELDALVPLPRPGDAAKSHAATIVRLLESAIADPSNREWIGSQALRFIAGTVTINARALTLLVRCLERPVTDAWGLLPLRPVLARLGEVAAPDPDVAGTLAAAPFLFDASDDRTVSLSSSLILSLNESWSQAHEHLCYVVAKQSWTAFDASDPVAATNTLAVILQHFSSDARPRFPISWNGIHGEVGGGQPLGLSGRSNVSELVNTSVQAMCDRASDGNLDTVLAVWTSRITHPDAWNRLLEAAANESSLALQLGMVLVESNGLFVNMATRPSAIRLAAVLSPLVTTDEHRQLEGIALALPVAEPDGELRHFMELACDQLIVSLERDRVQEPDVRARLAEIDASGDTPPPIDRFRPFTISEIPDDYRKWELAGVDPETVPDLVKNAVSSAESALADSADEVAMWAALSAAVTAESEPANVSPVVGRLRSLIGRLLVQLASSGRVSPDDPLGDWVVCLLFGLAQEDALPPPPEELC